MSIQNAMKFIDKRTNEVKTAYSIMSKDNKVYVKFNEKGKEYSYNPENVEVIDETDSTVGMEDANRIYVLEQECYRCKKMTKVYTYIVFPDDTNEDVVFPWDKERLLRNQDIFAHIQDSSIEYYGLKIVGEEEKLDAVLLEKFPGKIKMQYSKTQGRSYPMNLCDNCKAKQGEYFIYRRINEKIERMEEIEVWGD